MGIILSKKNIILDLCGGTGSWSSPWGENGYTVYNITLPEYDVVRTSFFSDIIKFRNPCGELKLSVDARNVYGILAAPPCTQFSFARTHAKSPRDVEGGFETVLSCLRIVWFCQQFLEKDQQKIPSLRFWALENPYFGMLRWWLGKPAFVFDPWEFGDSYQKKTALWGHFKEPEREYTDQSVVMSQDQRRRAKTGDRVLPKFDSLLNNEIYPELVRKMNRSARRSITPRGFSLAFFESNSIENDFSKKLIMGVKRINRFLKKMVELNGTH